MQLNNISHSKKAMALPALAQLILGVIGFIVMLAIAILLYTAFGPTPDQNIATMEIIVGEINTGISLMERTGMSEYKIVFPLSLQSGYKIYAKSNEAKTQVKIQLYDPENHEVENNILSSLRELKFMLPTELQADSNTFFTQKQTLSNYRLTLKKETAGKYGATIEYCSDGWCLEDS